MADDLTVGRYVIPEAELHWTFSPSGGPGGQHANRSHTRAELRFDIAASEAFPAEVRNRIVLALSLTDGIVVVAVDESRSQWRNRQTARRRLAERLVEAMVPPTPRRPTKPTRASKQRRLDEKKARSETKRLRRPPPL
jgi:ribosome-associated protein